MEEGGERRGRTNLAESTEHLDDVLRLETDRHGSVERVLGEKVFMDEGRSGKTLRKKSASSFALTTTRKEREGGREGREEESS